MLNIDKHKNILLRILKDVYADGMLGSTLGFKGGTAAYLFYNLSRFSVDLDFDLLNLDGEDLVFEKIKKILENYGNVKEVEKGRDNLLFTLSYADKDIGAQNVNVDINRLNFGSKYEIKSYLGIAMKVMVQEDMFANKLVAMFERMGKTSRDVFDVWFFSKGNWSINKAIVENRTKMVFKEFLRKCTVSLEENLNERNVLAGVGELLDAKQKTWIKANLKKDVIFWLKVRLENEK